VDTRNGDAAKWGRPEGKRRDSNQVGGGGGGGKKKLQEYGTRARTKQKNRIRSQTKEEEGNIVFRSGKTCSVGEGKLSRGGLVKTSLGEKERGPTQEKRGKKTTSRFQGWPNGTGGK